MTIALKPYSPPTIKTFARNFDSPMLRAGAGFRMTPLMKCIAQNATGWRPQALLTNAQLMKELGAAPVVTRGGKNSIGEGAQIGAALLTGSPKTGMVQPGNPEITQLFLNGKDGDDVSPDAPVTDPIKPVLNFDGGLFGVADNAPLTGAEILSQLYVRSLPEDIPLPYSEEKTITKMADLLSAAVVLTDLTVYRNLSEADGQEATKQLLNMVDEKYRDWFEDHLFNLLAIINGSIKNWDTKVVKPIADGDLPNLAEKLRIFGEEIEKRGAKIESLEKAADSALGPHKEFVIKRYLLRIYEKLEEQNQEDQMENRDRIAPSEDNAEAMAKIQKWVSQPITSANKDEILDFVRYYLIQLGLSDTGEIE